MVRKMEDMYETNTELPVIPGVHLGDRKNDFKTLIEGILKKGNIKQTHVDILLSEKNIVLYGDCFTSELIDPNNNYQWPEQYGDLIGNKFIVNYVFDRFPQLMCAEGVKIAARLRINYGAKGCFSSIAEKLGFWPFISASNDLRQRRKKSLLEDVFEAFLGMTEYILNINIKNGVGYAVVFKILKSIFDEMTISLKYEDLYDAKTRLKELFDMCEDQLGNVVYEEKKENLYTVSSVYRKNKITGQRILIGQGSATLKGDAQQHASANAIKFLAKEGFIKHPPAIYARFANSNYQPTETTRENVLKICENDEKKINEQFFTRGKSKHQVKYTCTPLIHFCRKRDYAGIKLCLEMGANCNLTDSDGLTAMDVLLVGKGDNVVVKKVIKRFGSTIHIHKNILESYSGELNREVFTVLDKYIGIPIDNKPKMKN